MKNHAEKILLAGGSGLVGSILKDKLENANKEVHILTRKHDSSPYLHRWDPDTGFIEASIKDHTFDALVNLCGAGIADKRWTPSRKKILYDSRIIPTRLLWSFIKNQTINTGKFIQMSASGFYGNRTNPVYENDPPGSADDFMVQLTKDWEEAFLTSATNDVPHCRVRLGVVISARGGFIKRFLTPVRLFVAPYFGSGGNYISWIHETDLADMISIIIEEQSLAPIYNLSTPHPVTSKQFSKILRKVFNSMAIPFPIPIWVLNPLFGEMKSTILADVQMMPGVFQDMDYHFQAAEMEEALRMVEGRG